MSDVKLINRLRSHWAKIFWVLVLIGIGSSFLYQGMENVLDEYRLIRKGETTAGYITSAWEDAEPRDEGGVDWYHTAIYTYKLPDGRDFQGSVDGSGRLKPEFRNLSRPHPVEVTYLPDNPAISLITPDLPDSIFGLLRRQIYPYGIFSVLFLFLGFYLLRGLIRDVKHPSQDDESL